MAVSAQGWFSLFLPVVIHDFGNILAPPSDEMQTPIHVPFVFIGKHVLPPVHSALLAQSCACPAEHEAAQTEPVCFDA